MLDGSWGMTSLYVGDAPALLYRVCVILSALSCLRYLVCVILSALQLFEPVYLSGLRRDAGGIVGEVQNLVSDSDSVFLRSVSRSRHLRTFTFAVQETF